MSNMANTVVKMYRSKKSKDGAWGTEPISDKELKNLKDLPEGGGNFYLSFYDGTKRKMPPVGRFADIAKSRLVGQRRVQEAMGMGVVLPVIPPAPVPKAEAEIDAAISAYIEKISQADKNGEFRPNKTINSKKSELEKFHNWSKKSYVKEIDAELMRKFRDKLLKDGKSTTTVCNKLMIVTTFCKENPIEPKVCCRASRAEYAS